MHLWLGNIGTDRSDKPPLYGRWKRLDKQLLDIIGSTPDQDPRLHPRNRCVHEGFLSVALIPIRKNQEIIGLLQLNDREKDRFTLNMIHFFEGISASIGVALKRKQEEEALRQSEERLSMIYNTTADVIFLLDVEQDGEYRFNSVNPAFLSTTGLPTELVVGKSVKEVIPEPSLTLVLSKYRKAIQEKTIVRWEETSDYPTGKISGLVTIAPILDADGICQHLVGNVRDITDRKQAEEALQENKQLLEMTFLSLHEAVFIIDATNTEILDCNPAASEIFGYSREGMLGNTTAFLHVHESSLGEFRERLYPAVEEKGYLYLPELR